MEKRGVSAVIAVILMLMITIALSSMAYFYMSGVFTGATSQSFVVVNVENDTLSIRNNGDTPITSVTAYIGSTEIPVAVTPSTSGLVGYWSFNEGSGTTVDDSSGNGNDGTFVNSPTWVEGSFGNGLNFDGSSDYINVGSDDSIDFGGQNQITVSAWANIESSGSDSNKVVFKGLQFNFQPQYTAGDVMRMEINTGSYIGCTTPAGFTELGEWIHYAMTWNGTTAKIYKNGVLSTTCEIIGTINAAGDSSNLCIGSSCGSAFTDGTIDEVQVYNRALSESEVYLLYSGLVSIGGIGNVKILSGLSTGTNTVRLCTPTTCQTAYVTII